MKIRDFHITGQYPALAVETVVEDQNPQSPNTIKLNLGPWNYVSLLNEDELKSLVHLVYENQRHNPTGAMENLRGANLETANQSELP